MGMSRPREPVAKPEGEKEEKGNTRKRTTTEFRSISSRETPSRERQTVWTLDIVDKKSTNPTFGEPSLSLIAIVHTPVLHATSLMASCPVRSSWTACSACSRKLAAASKLAVLCNFEMFHHFSGVLQKSLLFLVCRSQSLRGRERESL